MGMILVPGAVERMQFFERRLHGERPEFSVNLRLSARPTSSKTFVLQRLAANGAFRGQHNNLLASPTSRVHHRSCRSIKWEMPNKYSAARLDLYGE